MYTVSTVHSEHTIHSEQCTLKTVPSPPTAKTAGCAVANFTRNQMFTVRCVHSEQCQVLCAPVPSAPGAKTAKTVVHSVVKGAQNLLTVHSVRSELIVHPANCSLSFVHSEQYTVSSARYSAE